MTERGFTKMNIIPSLGVNQTFSTMGNVSDLVARSRNIPWILSLWI